MNKTHKQHTGNVVINDGKATMLFHANVVVDINRRRTTTVAKRRDHI